MISKTNNFIHDFCRMRFASFFCDDERARSVSQKKNPPSYRVDFVLCSLVVTKTGAVSTWCESSIIVVTLTFYSSTKQPFLYRSFFVCFPLSPSVRCFSHLRISRVPVVCMCSAHDRRVYGVSFRAATPNARFITNWMNKSFFLLLLLFCF